VTIRFLATSPRFRGPLAWLMAAGLVVAGWGGEGKTDQPAPSVYRKPEGPSPRDPLEGLDVPPPPPKTVEQEDAAAQAERIVLSASGVIAKARSFSVQFRQKARVGDRVLVGTGRYLQSGLGEDQRFRFDSTLTGDTETFEYTEVSDGLFCWTFRHYGEEPAALQRVDVRRIRAKLAELKAPDAADGASYLGGLQRMIRLVRHTFRFTKATPIDLDEQPVWLVEGSWFGPFVPIVIPQLKEQAATPEGIQPRHFPDGVPCEIRIAVGRNDLLPRRIEWLAIPGRRPVGDAPLEPIAVMDFHDAEINGPVDATAFFYQPAIEGMVDVTDMTVSALGLMR